MRKIIMHKSPRLISGLIVSAALLAGCENSSEDHWYEDGQDENGFQTSPPSTPGSSSSAPSSTSSAASTSAGTSSSASSAAPSNLLTNGGFESGDGYAPWSINGGDSAATLAVISENVHDGSFSLMITDRTESYAGPSYDITSLITDGVNYQVSAWLQLDESVSAEQTFKFTVTENFEDGAETSYERISDATVQPGEWVEFTGTYVQDSDNSVASLTLYVEVIDEETVDADLTFYLDSVSLLEATETSEPSGTNLINNPGFESGSAPDWIQSGNPSLEVTTDQANNGSNSLFVSGRENNYDGPEYDVFADVDTTKTYDFSMWVYATGNGITEDPPLKVTMKELSEGTDGEETNYENFVDSTVPLNQWTQVSGTYSYTLGETAATGLSFYVESDNTDLNYYMDDVVFQEQSAP